MGRSALEAIGMSGEEAQAAADGFEAEDRKFLVELAPLYDPEIPIHENTAFTDRVREIIAIRDADIAKRKGSEDDELDDPVTSNAVEG